MTTRRRPAVLLPLSVLLLLAATVSAQGLSLYYRVEPLEPAPAAFEYPVDAYETAATSALGPYEFGWDFQFWGNPYKAFYVCSNGWVALVKKADNFGPGGCDRTTESTPIPRKDSLLNDQGFIAIWQTAQDDYEAGDGPSVAVATADGGAEVGKQVHVRWANCSVSVPSDPADVLGDFQVTFQEEGNTITFLYIDTPGTNTPVLAGIQDEGQSKVQTIPDGNARSSFPVLINKAYVLYDWTNNMLLYGSLALVGGVCSCLLLSICCSFAAARARRDAHNMHTAGRLPAAPPKHVDGSGKHAEGGSHGGSHRGASSASKGSRRGAGGSVRGGSKGSKRGSRRGAGGSQRSKGSNRRPKVAQDTFQPPVAEVAEPLVNEEEQ